MCSAFHVIEVLSVFYLKETHKEGPEFLSSCSTREITPNYLTLNDNTQFIAFYGGKKKIIGTFLHEIHKPLGPFCSKLLLALCTLFTLCTLIPHERKS